MVAKSCPEVSYSGTSHLCISIDKIVIMSPTTIVNIKHSNCDVYCGRGSPFGNVFVIGRDGDRNEVCEKFKPYFYKKLQNPKFRAKVMSEERNLDVIANVLLLVTIQNVNLIVVTLKQ